jgi:hypothetical protein
MSYPPLNNPPLTEPFLFGTTTRVLISGEMVFPDIHVDKVGTYTLEVSSSNLSYPFKRIRCVPLPPGWLVGCRAPTRSHCHRRAASRSPSRWAWTPASCS